MLWRRDSEMRIRQVAGQMLQRLLTYSRTRIIERVKGAKNRARLGVLLDYPWRDYTCSTIYRITHTTLACKVTAQITVTKLHHLFRYRKTAFSRGGNNFSQQCCNGRILAALKVLKETCRF